ncbi:hypothetical protein pEaSNUABM10_00160 [Erwinia phage pEa_SNUABM_10]|nr:hypothetical protein pEaSNUABM10_00160 [Erwinia phage pEa_SNUABM_10]
MQFYSEAALQLIYRQVNRDNPNLPVPISDDTVAVKDTVKSAGSGAVRNSTITVVGKPGRGYYGKTLLYFDRVQLPYLFFSTLRPMIYLPKTVTTLQAALPYINSTLGITLTIDDLATPTTVLSPTSTPTNISVGISGNSPAFIGPLHFSYQLERGKYYAASGPGPKYLLLGDENFGYFGKVTTAEMFTNLELWNVTLAGKGTTAQRQFFVEGWFKFFYKGNVIFMPQGPTASNLSWNDLYNLGYMYGIDGVGKYPTTTPVSQLRQISLNKAGVTSYFRLRTPRASLNEPDAYFVGRPGTGNYAGSELELLTRLFSGGEWGNENGSQWGQWCMMQDTISSNPSTSFRTSTMTGTNWSVGTKSGAGSSQYWWPVLELIDLNSALVPTESVIGRLENTLAPVVGTANLTEGLSPVSMGVPKTVEFSPVSAQASTISELHPLVLGLPKTTDYKPIAATAANRDIQKTDLSDANGELDGF